MFAEIPQNLILMTVGAFLLGWILASISARLSFRYRALKRDARDDRIRSLEADLRVAHTDVEQKTEKVAELEVNLDETTQGIVKRDNVISHQQQSVDELRKDLRESVMKTRELRHELSDRATESVRSEAKMREIETELSVAQASTDLLATGVLDYSVAPDNDSGEDQKEDADSAGLPKTAS
ncbi:MAG: hypothetical protein OER97_05475 [Gammaproteobacteria bacterium]|nr:hypothetical protein [Gammaproteobacteria bacterium]